MMAAILQHGEKERLSSFRAQVRRAITWTFKNAASFAGDANRLYVSGNSSGAHLAAVAFTTDWQKDFGCQLTPSRAALC